MAHNITSHLKNESYVFHDEPLSVTINGLHYWQTESGVLFPQHEFTYVKSVARDYVRGGIDYGKIGEALINGNGIARFEE